VFFLLIACASASLSERLLRIAEHGLATAKYTVVSGDTCSGIAKAHGITETQLQSYNPTLNCSKLEDGKQILTGPGGSGWGAAGGSGTPTPPTGGSGWGAAGGSGTLTPTTGGRGWGAAGGGAAGPRGGWGATGAPPTAGSGVGPVGFLEVGVTAKYTVVSGDTCWGIANAHSISVAQLQSYNPSINCNNLQIGQQVATTAGASGGGGGGNGGCSGLVSFSQFSKAVTSTPFGYPAPTNAQYCAFVSNAASAGGITTVRELAMFLSEILWESGGLIYKSEIACTPPKSCSGSYDWNGNYQFYGRGYIQLTWSANYKSASQALYGDLRLYNNPTTVATDENQAWSTALWFWKTNVHPDSGVQQGHLGSATNRINGGLECGAGASNPSAAQNRFRIYQSVLPAFGDFETPNSSGC